MQKILLPVLLVVVQLLFTSLGAADAKRHRKPPVDTKGPCRVQQRWYDGCNWCRCRNGFLAGCTESFCLDNYRETPGCPYRTKPRDTWFAKCNKFSCIRKPDGTLVTEETLKGECWTAKGPCANSNSWFDGCNRCLCLSGEPLGCTKKLCKDNEIVKPDCPPGKQAGDTWYAACNRHTCRLNEGGALETLSTVRGDCW